MRFLPVKSLPCIDAGTPGIVLFEHISSFYPATMQIFESVHQNENANVCQTHRIHRRYEQLDVDIIRVPI